MTKKIECDRIGCKVKFLPKARNQRFCGKPCKAIWHQRERARLIQMARDMGIGGKSVIDVRKWTR